MTFHILPTACTTYIHTFHTYTIVKTRKKDKNKIKILSKRQNFAFSSQNISKRRRQKYYYFRIANFDLNTSKLL